MITPLSEIDRDEILQFYERWRLEDFEVVAFAYTPVPDSTHFDSFIRQNNGQPAHLNSLAVSSTTSALSPQSSSKPLYFVDLTTGSETLLAKSSSTIPQSAVGLVMEDTNLSQANSGEDENGHEAHWLDNKDGTALETIDETGQEGAGEDLNIAGVDLQDPDRDVLQEDNLPDQQYEAFSDGEADIEKDHEEWRELDDASSLRKTLTEPTRLHPTTTLHPSDLDTDVFSKTFSEPAKLVKAVSVEKGLANFEPGRKRSSTDAPYIDLADNLETRRVRVAQMKKVPNRKGTKAANRLHGKGINSLSELHIREVKRIAYRSLWSIARQQIFIGMIASSVPVRQDIPVLKESLDSAGVRFIYFSPRNMKRSKPIAEKVGIPFDWNCAISLRDLDDDHCSDPHRHISTYADWDVLGMFHRFDKNFI